ncbi:MAG: putative Ig domain-containing protein, partial [Blastocatellia bacterium]
MPEAKVGAEYEYHFQTEGGLAPLKWSVVAGVTPPGIRLEENGQLRGAPTLAKAEAYTFVVEVADSAKTPQRFSLPCSMMVQAAPLRIVTGAPKLRILTKSSDSSPNAHAVDNNQPSGQAGSRIADVSNSAVTEARPAASLAPAPVDQRRGFSAPIPGKRVNPADFIRIYEDTVGAKRILIYDPTVDERIRVEKLSADKASKLIIVPDPDLMDAELALNNLYMRATLAPRNAELEIEGYSMVGESRAAVQAQRAVAFQSVKNIIGKILTMAFTADDIVE